MSEAHLTDVSFTNLNLPESLARGIADAGFERCTPIQAQTLPRALAGFDVAGQAQTGTGKTAAFALPLLQKLSEEQPNPRGSRAPRLLVLVETEIWPATLYAAAAAGVPVFFVNARISSRTAAPRRRLRSSSSIFFRRKKWIISFSWLMNFVPGEIELCLKFSWLSARSVYPWSCFRNSL
jgi:hypothetical protein